MHDRFSLGHPMTTEEKVHRAAPVAVAAKLIRDDLEKAKADGKPAPALSPIYRGILKRDGEQA